MLEMRPDCERCGADLPPATEAYICSFECTFCGECGQGELAGICPNCSGVLDRRPSRAEALLARYPAGAVRKGPG